MNVRVGYEYEPGRITYWSFRIFTRLRPAQQWARRLNQRGLPGKWIVWIEEP